MNDEIFDKALKNIQRVKAKEEFLNTPREAFTNLSDKELAAIQSDFEPYDPQYILASHEWNCRLLSRQLESSRFSTWAGIGGTVIGVILGYLLK